MDPYRAMAWGIFAVVLAVVLAVAAVAGWHLLMDLKDKWDIRHEGVDEKSRPLAHEFAIKTPTQEMPAVFTIPQAWIEQYSSKPAGRHRQVEYV